MEMQQIIKEYATNIYDLKSGEQVLIVYDYSTDPVVEAFDSVSRALGGDVVYLRYRPPDAVVL